MTVHRIKLAMLMVMMRLRGLDPYRCATRIARHFTERHMQCVRTPRDGKRDQDSRGASQFPAFGKVHRIHEALLKAERLIYPLPQVCQAKSVLPSQSCSRVADVGRH